MCSYFNDDGESTLPIEFLIIILVMRFNYLCNVLNESPCVV